MPAITFFEEDIVFKLRHKSGLRNWISETIISEGFKLKELNFIFCSDNYLLQINKEYLNHDTYTDIVTFDNSEIQYSITGDIFISVDRVRENASIFKVTELDELHRVVIHGTLHLLGYKDKNKIDKEKMTLKEDFYLNKRNFNY